MSDSLKKIYRLLPTGDKVKLYLLFAMILVASLMEVVAISMVPLFFGAIMDIDWILNLPLLGEWLQYLEITSLETIALYGAIILTFVFVIKNGYHAFFFYLKKRYIANRGVYLQDRLFKAYMAAPYTFYIGRNSSELLRNVAGEVRRIVDQVLLPVLEVLHHIVMFSCIITMLIVVEPLNSLLTIGILGGVGFLFLRFTERKTSDYGKQDRDLRTVLNKSVLQGLGGFKDARMLGRERLFIDEYRENAIRSKIANIYLYVVKQLPKPIIESLAVITILLITLIMISQDRPSAEIAAVLMLFGASAFRIMPVFNATFSNISIIRFNIHSVDTVYDDLMLLEKGKTIRLADIYSQTEKLPLESSINVNDVSYFYPDSGEQAVKNVSLTISKGDAVAFVGASGAGKTTLADLILGLLEPQSGSITVDNQNIQSNLRGWQKNIGYVPQHIYLMDDTIWRNIAFGMPDNELDPFKLEHAIEAAQLRELIDRLEEGENTMVGERGIRLSGGQRQRIGIARALYNNPQLLVMDEATAALDNITEKYVIEAIEKLRGDRTIIMIAHRLTTVRNCDRLFLFENGHIIEQGDYKTLLSQNDKFRELAMES